MPEVMVRKGEPVDRALKRLKNQAGCRGILEESAAGSARSRRRTKKPPQSQANQNARTKSASILLKARLPRK